jgi:hypothetical protein
MHKELMNPLPGGSSAMLKSDKEAKVSMLCLDSSFFTKENNI